VKTLLICVVVTATLALAVFYRSCRSGKDLNVDPNAREEIEKAKHR